jgi:RNA polymerase sigma-70 factor (ECF subfamily)
VPEGKMLEGTERNSTPGQSSFATTHWSIVLAAGNQSSPDYTRALSTLCQTYWYPLYAYLRRWGCDRQQAEDYTQSFFASLIERQAVGEADPKRGKFRSFLLSSLKHFLADEWDRTQAQKRGGDIKILSLDIDDGETRYGCEPVDELTPEKLFERHWAQTVLKQAMTRLKAEYVTAGKQQLFDHLKTCLTAEQGSISYSNIAVKLDMTEGAVKVAVHRLRHRYAEFVREQIAQTVATPEQIDEEINELYAALAD